MPGSAFRGSPSKSYSDTPALHTSYTCKRQFPETNEKISLPSTIVIPNSSLPSRTAAASTSSPESTLQIALRQSTLMSMQSVPPGSASFPSFLRCCTRTRPSSSRMRRHATERGEQQQNILNYAQGVRIGVLAAERTCCECCAANELVAVIESPNASPRRLVDASCSLARQQLNSCPVFTNARCLVTAVRLALQQLNSRPVFANARCSVTRGSIVPAGTERALGDPEQGTQAQGDGNLPVRCSAAHRYEPPSPTHHARVYRVRDYNLKREPRAVPQSTTSL